MTTIRIRHRVRLGLLLPALALAGVRPVEAQLSITSACTPGIPGCTQLSFRLSAATDLALDALTLTLDPSSPFEFEPLVPGGTVGVYQAEDALGAFGGPSLIGSAGRAATLDFLASGAPLTLPAGLVGRVDVAVLNPTGAPDTRDLGAQFLAVAASGVQYTGVVTAVPEPAAVALLSVGLLALGTARHARGARRRG
jgi:hypothetical protein